MIQKILLRPVVLASVLCLFATPIVSQEEESQTADAISVEGTSLNVTVESDQIPQFIVVENLFRRLEMVKGHPRAHGQILREMGIEPGSEAADFLGETTMLAMETLNVSTIDSSLTGDAFMEYQYRATGEKARKLGVVFRELLSGLEEAGVSPSLIRNYCEEKIRPSLKVFSSGPADERYAEAVAEFEKQLYDLH